jgi:hypothetical protein
MACSIIKSLYSTITSFGGTMSDLFDSVKGGQDFIQKILSYVPGFKGYIERTQRRAADKLLRDQVALKYKELATRLSGMKKDFVDAGQFDLLEEVDSIHIKLMTFSDRIKNASYGYSGLFDTVKINEKELEKLYSFDLTFFEIADQISSGLDNVAAGVGGDGLKAALRSVDGLALLVGETYDKRYQILNNPTETPQP